MPSTKEPIANGFVPVLRYRNVAAAADWLCRAFGFETHRVVDDGRGNIIYAQLRFGRGLVMLVPVGQSDLDALMVQPDLASGLETQVCYVAVGNVAAHVERAAAAGAEIVLGVSDDGLGGAGYTCRDPEGHVWTFGTYDPAAVSRSAEPAASEPIAPPVSAVVAAQEPDANPDAAEDARSRWWKSAAVAAVMFGALLAGGGLIAALVTSGTGRSPGAAASMAARETHVTPDAPDALETALDAKRVADQTATEAARSLAAARDELSGERAAKETALQSLATAKDDLEAVRSSLSAAETARREAVVALENERELRARAEEIQKALLLQLEDMTADAADASGAGSQALMAPAGQPGAASGTATPGSSTTEAAAAEAAVPAPPSTTPPAPPPSETGSVGGTAAEPAEPASSDEAVPEPAPPAAARDEARKPAQKRARREKEKSSDAPAKPRPKKATAGGEQTWPYSSW